MNQPIKFPDMRPPKDRRTHVNLPTPEGYRQRIPNFATSDGNSHNRRMERKRLLLWFGVAVALHAALLLALWLTPPLRLKWGPPSDAWIQVSSVPAKSETPNRDAQEHPAPSKDAKPGVMEAGK